MVYKISKGGIRTGNTLRGLNSKRTKRYGRHACLLGSTNLGRRDLGRLITDSSGDDDETEKVKETLNKTNVPLSLNKKQRWRLPDMFSHMIKTGHFNKGSLVSLLEKHKLKRRANCVRLVSNSKKKQNIVPKQKKYFSFSLDSFWEDESNRQKRKTLAQEIKKLPNGSTMTRNRNNYKTVEVYTSEGNSSSVTASLESDKPEYRLEVFYPCPRSCSLTYNPKYTDVVIVEGEYDQLEVKSRKKQRKKGATKHRKRLLLKDIDLRSEEVEEDVSDLWEEDERDECNEEDEMCEENMNVEDENKHASRPSHYYSIDSTLIDNLLMHAQKTRELCLKKKNFEPRSNRKCKFPDFVNIENKTHIVLEEKENINKVASVNTKNVFSHLDNTLSDDFTERLSFVKLILRTSEISPTELRQQYGTLYSEASCQPRRFIIDFTLDIGNLLATSKSLTQEFDFSSYLVCIYDGFYDDGLAIYKIAFNTMTTDKMNGLSNFVPLAQTSIPDILNGFACHLLDLKEKNAINYVENNHSYKAKSNDYFLNKHIKLKVEVFDLHEMPRAFLTEEEDCLTEIDIHKTFASDIDEDLFCDVCYANVTPTKFDSVDATKLNTCGHFLCDECWAAHFRACIKIGKTTMTCGGYDCNTKVGSVTLMSILKVSELNILLQRQAEEKIELMDNVKYCPYPECGRVIKVNSKSEDTCVDVICACGNKLCFACLGPAHWPAKCGQAEEYLERLPDLKPAKEYIEESSTVLDPTPIAAKPKVPTQVMVEGRICPNCRRFIEKNGGCREMFCKCGFRMCWKCMKNYHYDLCHIDRYWVYTHTRVLIVKHSMSKKITPLDSLEGKKLPSIQKNRQKISLYQRALQQRQETMAPAQLSCNRTMMPLVCKIVNTANKDLQFKKEIVRVFLPDLAINDETPLMDLDLYPYLKTFFKTTINMKKELHHVIEYTFILLQDTPPSIVKQRILKLANDLIGFCAFVRSILSLQDNQDPKAAFRRLANLQEWAKRALDALIRSSRILRTE